MRKQQILITLDAVRADHVTCYGYDKKTTPVIDRFSSQSMRFKRCFAPAPYTLGSLPSLFCGQYPLNSPLRFGFQDDTKPYSVGLSDFSLLSILRDNNILTAAFTSNPLTSSHYLLGFNKLFDYFSDEYLHLAPFQQFDHVQNSKKIISDAISWIKKNKDNNFFVWLHLMDAHGPYVPNKRPLFSYNSSKKISRIIYDYKTEFLHDYQTGKSAPGIPRYQVQRIKRDIDGNINNYEMRASFYVSKYDTGIAIMDNSLKHLFETLVKLELYDTSQIIIHSDHGESMGEHNIWFTHGLTTTADVIHVPCIIKSPTIKNTVIESNVSLLGIAGTTLKYFSIPNSLTESSKSFDKYTGKEIVYSYGPKNFTLGKENEFYSFHHGSLDLSGTIDERMFPLNKTNTKKYTFRAEQFTQESWQNISEIDISLPEWVRSEFEKKTEHVYPF